MNERKRNVMGLYNWKLMLQKEMNVINGQKGMWRIYNKEVFIQLQ